MEDRDAEEFILLLKGYFRLLAEKELSVTWESHSSWQAETGNFIIVFFKVKSQTYFSFMFVNLFKFKSICNQIQILI